MRSLGPALFALMLLRASAARADGDDDEMADALAELDRASKELALSAPCDTMCKALQSMVRAADRVCELARDGSAADQKRCTDAKQRVAEATARVRAACPDCNPSPPYAPSTAPAAGTGKKPAMPPPATPATPATEDAGFAAKTAGEERSERAPARKTTLSLDLLPLFTPAYVVQPRLEQSVTSRFSLSLTGGLGSLPKNGGGRASVMTIGGELRGYVVGRFDGFGVFVGVDLNHRTAQLPHGETLAARTYPIGLSVGTVVGTKLVTKSGFTLEARFGVAYLANDRRFDGGARLLPDGGFAVGWTF